MAKNIRFFWIPFLCIVAIVILAQLFYFRVDATQDQRYTLTQSTKNIVKAIDKDLEIELLLGGELTGDYRILKNEIEFLLQELRNLNPKISYSILNPTEDFTTEQLQDFQLSPVSIPNKKGALNIYPYARVTYATEELDSAKIQEVWFPTLVNNPSIAFKELALASVEKLEYIFMNNIQNITQRNPKKIGIVVHHDELPEKNLRGFGQAISAKYNLNLLLKPLIDSTYSFQPKDLKQLLAYDAIVLPKPTLPFTEKDKLVLDQYIMNGGKTLWMLETVDAEMDSIFRSDQILAFPRQLNLNDFLFAYGIRIYPTIIKDLEGGKIALADGETAGNVNYNFYTWPYFLRAKPAEPHPINQSLNAVRMEFANPIEILDNPNIKPTVLLSSSSRTNFKSPLTRIKLEEINIQNPEQYQAGAIPTAVLLEGDFSSAYANRFERQEFNDFKAKTTNGKMIVISDGDVAKNHLWLGNPMALGEDKYTMRPDNPNQRAIVYDNQAFLLNCLDYLLGNDDFLYLKNRELQIPLLDSIKVKQERSFWQTINLLVPFALIGFLAFVLIWTKKKCFSL